MGKTFLPSNRLANRLFAVATALMFFALMPTAHGASATQASAGRSHTCAVTSSGGVQCWGWNAAGQLGDGTTIDRVTPVAVSGLASGVAAVTAGIAHTCALMVAGGVKCWGQNFYGELGDGTTTNRNAPVDVLTLTSGVSAIASGGLSTCAVLTAGGVSCWGYNAFGQLGDGTLVNRSTPVPVAGLGSAAVAVGQGTFHSCAVLIGGAVKCWGYGMDGQIGDGLAATTPRPAPVDVVGLSTGVTRLALGAYHSCALLASGGVKCWGYNGLGTLGDGTTTQRRAPVDVVGLASGVASIAASVDGYHTCAVLAGGALRCWGSNAQGQLGIGDFSTQASPVAVTAIGTSVSSIALGTNHTCAIIAGSGGVACWGSNGLGQLGDGGGTNVSLPQDVIGLTSGVQTLSNGGEHACAVTTAGGVKCWGRNDFGQLGNGLAALSSVAVDVTGLTSGVANVTVGSSHSCALTTAGGVKCWGLGTAGQLGNSSAVNQSAPVNVTGLASGVAAIASKGNHTCALLSSGGIKCWGNGGSGQLGEGAALSRSSPVNVTGLSTGVSAIGTGLNHTCAVLSAGGTKCWGFNSSGQLGINSTVNSSVPADAVGLSAGSVRVGGGSNHACGVNSSGALLCWGSNTGSQLGDGTNVNKLVPTAVPSLSGGIASSTGGTAHSCALSTTGVATCWGDGARGQLGRGSFFGNILPSVATVGTYAALSAGGDMTCGVTTAGGAKCWGNNTYGQLGSGATSVRLAPATTVVGFAASVTTVAATPSPSLLGQVVAIRATIVGAAPTGSVNFKDGGVSISGCASVAVSGGAVCSTALLTLGSHNLQADYSGDVNNPASVSPVITHVVNPVLAAVTLASSANPSIALQGVTFTATVGGATAPTGSVRFYDGTPLIAGCASVALSGGNPAVATCGPITSLGNGTRNVTAAYLGDVNNGINQVQMVQTVTQTAASRVPSIASSVSLGSTTLCSIDSSGGLRCWGDNSLGTIGDGSIENRAVPTLVTGMGSGVRSAAVGYLHACAVTSAGGARCWGWNGSGQLGDGTTTNRLTPTDVPGLSSGVAALAAGFYHSCALLTDGTVKCWGANNAGQLGTGAATTVTELAPVTVAGFSGPVVGISAGGNRTCALLANGGLQCWGSGGVGDGTTTLRSVPTTVLGLAGPVVKVAAGDSHTCALLLGGGMQCWGNRNFYGELGDGAPSIARLLPTNVTGITSATALSLGRYQSCAVLLGGALKCWGNGDFGAVGDGLDQQSNVTPRDVVGLSSGVLEVAVGRYNACALTTGGGIRCWGRNNVGQLGNGSFGFQATPTLVAGLSGIAEVAAGGIHTCARDSGGSVKCWGYNYTPQASPSSVTGLSSGVALLSAGYSHACVVTSAGGAKCWGENSSGSVGDGTTAFRATPVDVVGLTSGVASISAGAFSTCAVTTTGGVKCWGDGTSGQLGNGGLVSQSSPVNVTGLASGVSAVSAGFFSSCALLTTGGVKCWGYNNAGQLGDGTTITRSTPVDVVGLSSGVVAISVGSYASCALLSGGTVKCWGANDSGSLGEGGVLTGSLTPVSTLPLGATAVKLAAGSGACAVLSDGSVRCWGYNGNGGVGDGTTLTRSTPVTPLGLASGVASISKGYDSACALTTTGTVKCWGDNTYGQMGNGTVGSENTARRYVAAPSLTRPLAVADRPNVTAAIDGALIARYLAGISGGAITQGVDTNGSLRTESSEVKRYLDIIRPLLDIDGNNEFNPLTDGLLLLRYLQGLRGSALIAGAVGMGASRSSAIDIEAYLAGLLP